MKTLLLIVLGTSLVAAAWMAAPREAVAEVEYPWCIITGGNSEGAYSCGYVSFEQCQQTRIGTDMCVANPRYRPSPAPSNPVPAESQHRQPPRR